jgi:hypothetical protein
MKKLIVIIIVFTAAVILYSFWPEREIKHPAGILIDEVPVQKEMSEKKTWQKNGYDFTALAEFLIKARVLSTNSFWSGKEKEISPVDFALGWGPMSDQAVLDHIKITQRNRWYYWKADFYPIPKKEIILNSANMHIIPATDKVEDLLDDVYKGCLIEMKGYLVEVKDKTGWRWKSSLRRDDTGGGSCEVVWIDEMKILSDSIPGKKH